MKCYLFLIVSILSFQLCAQQSFKVVYSHAYGVEFGKKKNTSNSIRKEFLFINNDSVSFYCFSDESIKGMNGEIGFQKNHHAIYSFFWLKRYLFESSWVKPYYLEEAYYNSEDWSLESDTIIICGYVCRMAKSDKLIAWYTDQISANTGPAYYSGLPGLILQIHDSQRKWLITAESIENNYLKIVLPDGMKINPVKNGESKIGEIEKYFLH